VQECNLAGRNAICLITVDAMSSVSWPIASDSAGGGNFTIGPIKFSSSIKLAITSLHLVLKVYVELPHDKWGTFFRAHLSCCPKHIPPRCVVGCDVGPHHIESFVPHDKLKDQEDGGDYTSYFHLERIILPFFPQKGNPFLFVARHF
jgi:hypothetical protein